jgi:hypothetical protein
MLTNKDFKKKQPFPWWNHEKSKTSWYHNRCISEAIHEPLRYSQVSLCPYCDRLSFSFSCVIEKQSINFCFSLLISQIWIIMKASICTEPIYGLYCPPCTSADKAITIPQRDGETSNNILNETEVVLCVNSKFFWNCTSFVSSHKWLAYTWYLSCRL